VSRFNISKTATQEMTCTGTDNKNQQQKIKQTIAKNLNYNNKLPTYTYTC